MSYDRSGEYTILPMEPYKIARNCSGCGGKSVYQSTGKFRVNGNGKRLDVWLIYQCIHCKHTYNLAIYSRVSKELLRQNEYRSFLGDDQKLAFQYGLDKTLLQKNGAQIYEEPPYRFVPGDRKTQEHEVRIHNPFHIRIREDKLIAEVFGISRSEAKRMLEAGKTQVEQESTAEVVICYQF